MSRGVSEVWRALREALRLALNDAIDLTSPDGLGLFRANPCQFKSVAYLMNMPHKVTIQENGRVVLPAAFRCELRLETGRRHQLLLEVVDGQGVIRTELDQVSDLQKTFSPFRRYTQGADELVDERRRAAAADDALRSRTDMFYDAYALLALVLGEPGSEVATRHLVEGRISTVNLAGVMSTLANRGAARSDLSQRIHDLLLDIEPFRAEAA